MLNLCCWRDRCRPFHLEPKAIVSRLLGADINMGAADDTVTGEAGGKLLACYLFSIKDKEAWLTAAGVKAWLEAQLPKYSTMWPAQKAAMEQAIAFLPKLERGLTAAAAARAPAPSFDTPDTAPRPSRAAPAAVPPPISF